MIRSALPAEAQLLDSLVLGAYDDAGRTAALIHGLREEDPSWDPDLVLVHEEDGELPDACLVLRPRQIMLRGVAVPVAVVAALAVHHAARGRGLAKQLMDEGAVRAAGKGGLALLGLGPSAIGAALDFHPAFGHCSLRLAPDQDRWTDLPEVRWRALESDDLETLCTLHHATALQADGAELRQPAAPDWASADPQTHSVVLDGPRGPEAYVRFTVQDQIVAADPVIGSARAAHHLVAFLFQVVGEHHRQACEVRAPLDHPFTRHLVAHGAVAETHALMEAARMRVLDPAALAETLAPGRGADALAGANLVPVDIPGLLTGQRLPPAVTFGRSTKDEALLAAFPPGHPWWPLSPLFDSVWL